MDGARVIKVERPGTGDFARNYDKFAKGCSSYFSWLNAGKESLVVDYKNSEDKRLLLNICKEADIVVQNLAPGATKKVGLHSEALRELNPKLITLDISGYGKFTQNSPHASYKAYDLLVAAEAGLCSITGTAESPGRVGISICDIVTGLNGYSALLKALISRSITGHGISIHTSLFEGIAELMTVPMLQYESTGKSPKRMGLQHPSISPYGVFKTKDMHQIIISIQNEREWKSFKQNILSLSDDDARFDSPAERLKFRHELDGLITKRFREYTREELTTLLVRHAIAFGFVNSLRDLVKHPALSRTHIRNEKGVELSIISEATNFADNNSAHRPNLKVPKLGEDSEQIKKEFRH